MKPRERELLMTHDQAREQFVERYGFEPPQVTAEWVRGLLVEGATDGRPARLWGADSPGPPPCGSETFDDVHDHYLAYAASGRFHLAHARALVATVAEHGYGSEDCLVVLCSLTAALGIRAEMDTGAEPTPVSYMAKPPDRAWGVSEEEERMVYAILERLVEGEHVGFILPIGWELETIVGPRTFCEESLRLALGLDGFGWKLPSGLQIIATPAMPEGYALAFACQEHEGQERGFAAVANLGAPIWKDYMAPAESGEEEGGD
jgi:hypothetical protein